MFLFLFVFQLFGCGSVAQMVLSRAGPGDILSVHIGFTLGVMMAVYIAGGVSGKSSPLFNDFPPFFKQVTI